jgi:Leucine-rich repeat (LRR) protein
VTSENPYRAAGTFSGPAYTERSADRELRRAVEQNQRYPYMLAPRQSGKSSLLYRLRADLDPNVFRCGFVDLSTFRHTELRDYDRFLTRLFADFADTLRVPRITVTGQPKKDLLVLVATVPEPRVVLLLDEIDAVRRSRFKDTFFSDVRNIFNDRADPNQKELKRVQFVLAGAARVEELITDSTRSPFNVGKPIRLDDFTLEEVRNLCLHLDTLDATGLPERLHHHAGGSVYLTQLLLERLWDWLEGGELENSLPEAILERVDTLADQIVSEAAQDVHFRNITQLLRQDPEALGLWRRAIAGRTLNEQQWDRLRATGLTGHDRKAVYRNCIYDRVFGRKGPLDLRRLEPLRRYRPFIAIAVVVVVIFGAFKLGEEWQQRSVDAALRKLGATIATRQSVKFDDLNDEIAKHVYQLLLKLPQLRTLEIHSGDPSVSPLINPPPIEKLSALQDLDLRGTEIQKLPGLEKLSALQSLDLSGTQIRELPSLEKLTALRQLSLSNTPIRQLPGLEKLTALQVLYLNSTPIQELPGLEKLTALQVLYLDAAQIRELPSLEKLTALHILAVSCPALRKLSGLEKLSALRSLILYGTQIRELPGLEKLSALQDLNLSGTQIRELPGLEKLSALQDLNLSGTQIRELPGLEKLSALQSLYLDGTHVSRLPPIPWLAKLRTIFLGNTPFWQGLSDEDRKNLQH